MGIAYSMRLDSHCCTPLSGEDELCVKWSSRQHQGQLVADGGHVAMTGKPFTVLHTHTQGTAPAGHLPLWLDSKGLVELIYQTVLIFYQYEYGWYSYLICNVRTSTYWCRNVMGKEAGKFSVTRTFKKPLTHLLWEGISCE